MISLGLRLKGCAAEGALRLRRRLRWGRLTDAEGDGDVRQLPPQVPCTRALDNRCFIDGLTYFAASRLKPCSWNSPFGLGVTNENARVRLEPCS